MSTTIYTDGACRVNPGAGGYAAVVITDEGRTVVSGGYRLTTNNRMELMAAIRALESLPDGSTAIIFTDSSYLSNAITKGWLYKWQRTGLLTGAFSKKNADLWLRMLEILPKHSISFTWVKGHAGNELNEECDRLCVAESHRLDLPVDEGYENPVPVQDVSIPLTLKDLLPNSGFLFEVEEAIHDNNLEKTLVSPQDILALLHDLEAWRKDYLNLLSK